MSQTFFDRVRADKEIVDAWARVINENERFSLAFKILFQNAPFPFQSEDPLASWLDVISSHFDLKGHIFRIPRLVYCGVVNMFRDYGISSVHELQEYSSVFHFFLYLFWILSRAPYSLEKFSIFNFMTGFKISDTRVVLVGQDPLPESSSGYAFHETVCPSSEFILRRLQQESHIYGEFSRSSSQQENYYGEFSRPNMMEITDQKLDEARETCNMSGWINQKVLLMNSALSYSQGISWHMMEMWEIFTDFVVKYLSDTKETLVFIFAGSYAIAKESLVDKRKHLTLNVLHPAWYSWNTERNDEMTSKGWSRVLPFLNTNYYLYQKLGLYGMIDWGSISEHVPVRLYRLEYMMDCLMKMERRIEFQPWAEDGYLGELGRSDFCRVQKDNGTVFVRNTIAMPMSSQIDN